MSQSAWEQWGTKKPNNAGALSSAQDVIQNLLRGSPLSSASTASSDSESTSNNSFSLKNIWESRTSTIIQQPDLESGKGEENEEENAADTWPLWRRKTSDTHSPGILPAMSW